MIGILPGVPPNVAGFRASGEVTREDYEKIVFPEIRRHVDAFGHLNFVFFVDTSLKNFSAGAWIRDIWLGFKELARWHKVAIISDVDKVRHFTDAISHLLPGEYKGFPVSRLEDAIRWAASEEDPAPAAAVPDYIEALLPPQVKGESTQVSAQVTADKEPDAKDIFERASERLQDVNQWTDLCGSLAASFQLTDDTGEDLQGRAAKDDLIRIHSPGQGHGGEHSYDWVRIEKIEQPVTTATDELVLLQMRPSPAPPLTDRATAHFLEETATRTLVIERKGKKVSVTFFGRNEVLNTSQTDTSGNIRNTVPVALEAISLSRTQWKALVKGLLEKR